MTSDPDIVIDIRPIGFVRDPEGAAKDRSGRGVTAIAIRPELAYGLDGIEDYSHVQVIYWLHRIAAAERAELKQYPHHGRKEYPMVGVFALRCPGRPNLIGLSVAEVVRRDGAVLYVRGLDAVDGSPVLDIKPYSLRNDRPDTPRVSWYAAELWDKVHDDATS